MHSRIFNVLPSMKDYNKADENDVFEYMAGRADYVEEINTPKEIEEEMTYLLQVLKIDLPHVKLHKDSKGDYNLYLSMKDVKDKINRFDQNLNDRYGFLFLYENNMPFTRLEWYYYLLTRHAEDAVIQLTVAQVFDYHF